VEVNLYRDRADGTHRIVAWDAQFDIKINMTISAAAVYKKRSDAFHKISSGVVGDVVYGLSFCIDKEYIKEATRFLKETRAVIAQPVDTAAATAVQTERVGARTSRPVMGPKLLPPRAVPSKEMLCGAGPAGDTDAKKKKSLKKAAAGRFNRARSLLPIVTCLAFAATLSLFMHFIPYLALPYFNRW
jgi:hypothetical protein